MGFYAKIAQAKDLKNKKEKIVFRLLEIFPGALSWSTLFLAFFLSYKTPFLVAFFIICFDIYWFVRTIYFSFHLKKAFSKMKIYEKIDWSKKLKKLPQWKKIYHLVLLTMYKEPLEIIRESVKSVLNNDYPKDKIIFVLATEERGGKEDEMKAKIIQKEFSKKFFRFLVTKHPKNLPGEIAGKGSNETWGAKKAKEKIIDPLKIPYENIIFTTLDADTVLFKKYFSCVSWHYLKAKKPTQKSYQPIPLYINNIWQAPFFSRIFAFACTFWHTMNQQRPEKLITFSSHSMSFKALVDVGFKQTNVVSDDSRIFWQCFFYYDGDYETQPIFYPLAMDAICGKSFFKTLKNLYQQQKRWAYGVAEIPYFFFSLFKNKKVPKKKAFKFALELVESHWSWATAPLLIFLLGFLPLFLGGEKFKQTLLSYNLPKITSHLLTFAMLGILLSVYLSLILLPPLAPKYGKYKYFAFAFQWLFLPFNLILFSALPALDAQTRLMLGKYLSFWPTEKMRKIILF